MRFCFADSPYLGCCSYYGHYHGPVDHPDATGAGTFRPFDGLCWDELETHHVLASWLRSEYQDGWAMCASAPSLISLSIIPGVERVGVWVKPFASFKPNVNPGYCWEPVVFAGGRKLCRKLGRKADTVRDYVSANITLQKGTPGAKPPAFCNWVMDFLGFDHEQDTIDDLFPGSGAFTRARDARRARTAVEQLELTP